MRYTLLLHYREAEDAGIDEEAMEQGRQAMASYAATLAQAEVLLSAEVLQPSHATTTVRLADGGLQIQDGPFADTKEQLGGTIVIDVPDLEAALEWAGRSPSLHWDGVVEVRPGAVHVRDGVWHPST